MTQEEVKGTEENLARGENYRHVQHPSLVIPSLEDRIEALEETNRGQEQDIKALRADLNEEKLLGAVLVDIVKQMRQQLPAPVRAMVKLPWDSPRPPRGGSRADGPVLGYQSYTEHGTGACTHCAEPPEMHVCPRGA